MKRILSLVAVSAAILIPAAPAFATQKMGYICHATGSATNPYVLLHVPLNSAHFDAEKHEGDILPEVIEVDDEKPFRLCPGAQGPAGPAGPQGPEGPAGPQGPSGADGTNGVDGSNGTNGVDGRNGTDGLNGSNGANGSDANVEELRKLITELNNRLFILEHQAPAPAEAPVAPAAPVTGELPRTGSNGTTFLLIAAMSLLGAGAAFRLFAYRR